MAMRMLPRVLELLQRRRWYVGSRTDVDVAAVTEEATLVPCCCATSWPASTVRLVRRRWTEARM